MRDCTGKPVEDMGDNYLVLKEPLGNTKSLSRKIDRTRGTLERDSGKSVTDFACRNEMHQAAQHCLPRWDLILCTMSMQVVWMGVSACPAGT